MVPFPHRLEHLRPSSWKGLRLHRCLVAGPPAGCAVLVAFGIHGFSLPLAQANQRSPRVRGPFRRAAENSLGRLVRAPYPLPWRSAFTSHASPHQHERGPRTERLPPRDPQAPSRDRSRTDATLPEPGPRGHRALRIPCAATTYCVVGVPQAISHLFLWRSVPTERSVIRFLAVDGSLKLRRAEVSAVMGVAWALVVAVLGYAASRELPELLRRGSRERWQ